jgi:hypothetical protein
MSERTRDGLEAARARGRNGGQKQSVVDRPVALDPGQSVRAV